jgi:hypothetical protein
MNENPDKGQIEDLAEETEEQVVPFSQRRNTRICLSKRVAARLAKLGVPDDPAIIGATVSNLVDMTIDMSLAYLPDLTDVVATEHGLANRIAEMNLVHAELYRNLVELGALGEHRTLLATFQDMAQIKPKTI